MDGVVAINQMDKNKLLMLGFNLLNKLKLPCAVVAPQAKRPPPQSSSLPLEKPVSPKTAEVEGSRKRKRDSNNDDDIGEVVKREKRKMMNRVSAQNARDRKKVYVEDLERKIAVLEEKNKKLEEENQTLKRHTSTLSHEKEELEQKLAGTDITETDVLQTLLRETLLQEQPTHRSAAETVPEAVVSHPGFGNNQSELLASIFEEFSTQHQGDAGSPGEHWRGSYATDMDGEPESLAEGVPVVGGQQLQMEPTKELSAKEAPSQMISPYSDTCSTVINTDFCDSLLNPLPNAMCGSKIDTDCSDTETFLSCFVDGLLPNSESAEDINALDLDAFFSNSVPLTC